MTDEMDGAIEYLLNGIERMPNMLQNMIDGVIAVQDAMPMPEEGWRQFCKDVQYTNQKHGIDLRIAGKKPEEFIDDTDEN